MTNGHAGLKSRLYFCRPNVMPNVISITRNINNISVIYVSAITLHLHAYIFINNYVQPIIWAISNYKAIQLSFGLSHHLFKTKSTCLHKLGVYSQSELLRCFPHLLRIQNDECVNIIRGVPLMFTQKGGGLRLGTNLKELLG